MPVFALPYDQGTLDRLRSGVTPAFVTSNNPLINNKNNQLINNNNNQLINNNNNVVNGGQPAQPIVQPVAPPAQPAEDIVSILPVPPIPAASQIAQDGGIDTPSLPQAAITTVLGQDAPGETGFDAVDITFDEFVVSQDGAPAVTVDVLNFVPLDEVTPSPLPENVPVPIGTGVLDTIAPTAPNNIVPVVDNVAPYQNTTTTVLPDNVPIPLRTGLPIIDNVVPQNTTTPTATQSAIPLFTNGSGFATPALGGFATGTGFAPGLSTAIPTISDIIGITNLTENATAQACPYPGALPYNPEVDGTLYRRAPMPPLHPHVPSYLANQDAEVPEMSKLNAVGVSVHEWVRRGAEGLPSAGKSATPNFVQAHLGIFLCALAGLFVLMGGLWYLRTNVSRRPAVAQLAEEGQAERYDEKATAPRPWYTRFGFKRHDQPVPYAGHIGSFRDANTAEEGGLRAAMGGNWNSNGARGSWETQRTAPPAYHGQGGLADEKIPSGTEFTNARFV